MAASCWRMLVIFLFSYLFTCVLLDETVEESSPTESPILEMVAPPSEELSDPDNILLQELEEEDPKTEAELQDESVNITSILIPTNGSCGVQSYHQVLSGAYQSPNSDFEFAYWLNIDGIYRGNKSDKVSKKITCVPRNMTENETLQVQIVNSTSLLAKLGSKNDSQQVCVVVMFYAPWCMFCSKVAPHFNALARAFPQLDVLAIDAVHFSSLNTRFGTIAVPNILVFHNSKAVARFNNSERTLGTIRDFVANITGLKANESVDVTKGDYQGPLLSSPTSDRDHLLWLSWLFTIVFCTTIFAKSTTGQSVWNFLVNFGVEHHQHID